MIPEIGMVLLWLIVGLVVTKIAVALDFLCKPALRRSMSEEEAENTFRIGLFLSTIFWPMPAFIMLVTLIIWLMLKTGSIIRFILGLKND